MKTLIEIIATILVLAILGFFIYSLVTNFKNTFIMVIILVIVIIIKDFHNR